jgi:flavodoxin
VKNVATTIKHLKNTRNDKKLNEYENMVFQFPTSMKRKLDMQAYQGNVTKLRQQQCDLQSKYMTCNQQLFDIQTKEKGRNSLISTLNQNIKRQQNNIVRVKSLLRAENNKFVKRKKKFGGK